MMQPQGAGELIPNSILQGDCLEVVRQLPDKSIHCLVTSPPYFGLRDYGVEGQIGLEESPEAYVETLVGIFRELRRVLRDDGTVWLVLGDSYAANRSYQVSDSKWQSHDFKSSNNGQVPSGLKPKDLIGIPWRVALALQADGWYLRSDIIWHKRNPMPESVRDRPTKAHEYIFLLSKKARYYYDQEAVREPSSTPAGETWEERKTNGAKSGWREADRFDNDQRKTFTNLGDGNGRNRRTVWSLANSPFPGAHFAVFPPDLIRPCILAGCPAKVCAECGKPWVRVVEKTGERERRWSANDTPTKEQNLRNDNGRTTQNVYTDKGHRPTCTCNAPTAPGIVLDPFMGSGTVAQVAIEEGRNWLGVELNPDYIELAYERIEQAKETVA